MALVDLHIHTVYSDGSYTLPVLIEKLRDADIHTFSITDHDTIQGSIDLAPELYKGMHFICGAEFSCISPRGKMHILGYGYDPCSPSLQSLLTQGHQNRLDKYRRRLAHLETVHGIRFSPETLARFSHMTSVGKPHLAAELVKMGLAADITEGIRKYINGCSVPDDRLDAEIVIHSILQSDGVPVWAHPLGGEGETHLTREEFLYRLELLKQYGIRGLECHYSRYSAEETSFLLESAHANDLLVSGGSDCHGTNKNIALGELNNYGCPIEESELSLIDYLLQRSN